MAFQIYCLTNSVNGKQYIGQTRRLVQRLRQHKNAHSKCTALHSAIRKYGWEAFSVAVLAETYTVAEIDELEFQFIRKLNTLSPNGYNLVSGGRVNRELSEETRQRKSKSAKRIGISQACRDASNTSECRMRKSLAAKKRGVSKVCRDAQKRAVTGRKQSPEHRAKNGKQWRGKKRLEHTEFMKKFYSDPDKRKAHSERMKRWWAERKHVCSR